MDVCVLTAWMCVEAWCFFFVYVHVALDLK